MKFTKDIKTFEIGTIFGLGYMWVAYWLGKSLRNPSEIGWFLPAYGEIILGLIIALSALLYYLTHLEEEKNELANAKVEALHWRKLEAQAQKQIKELEDQLDKIYRKYDALLDEVALLREDTK
jgi:hypothetical protein